MNTNPADEILALWVEDELHGSDLAQVNAWAASNPEWLAHREDARRVKVLLRQALPAVEEPPYADFFNTRIMREIATTAAPAVASSQRETAPKRNWLSWFMPTAAAAAGMALCFWAGTHMGANRPETTAAIPHPQPEHGAIASNGAPEPFLYTPESGIKASWYGGGSNSSNGVIVLDGMAALPDSFEIPETASTDELPSSTASLEH